MLKLESRKPARRDLRSIPALAFAIAYLSLCSCHHAVEKKPPTTVRNQGSTRETAMTSESGLKASEPPNIRYSQDGLFEEPGLHPVDRSSAWLTCPDE